MVAVRAPLGPRVLVVPAALGLLPAPWNDRIGRFALVDAAQQVAASHPRPGCCRRPGP